MVARGVSIPDKVDSDSYCGLPFPFVQEGQLNASQRYSAKRKPRKCPACGSSRVVVILYGMPLPEMVEQEKAGRVFLGGCCIGNDDPRWHCLDCYVFIHRDAAHT